MVPGKVLSATLKEGWQSQTLHRLEEIEFPHCQGYLQLAQDHRKFGLSNQSPVVDIIRSQRWLLEG